MSTGISVASGPAQTVKGAWSTEEDEKLRQTVKALGCCSWSLIAQHLRGRSGKSCRLRWCNQLNPNLKRGPFSEEENAIILKLYEEFGSRWSLIAKNLPGRTDNAVKNHWHCALKKRVIYQDLDNTAFQEQHQKQAEDINEADGSSDEALSSSTSSGTKGSHKRSFIQLQDTDLLAGIQNKASPYSGCHQAHISPPTEVEAVNAKSNWVAFEKPSATPWTPTSSTLSTGTDTNRVWNSFPRTESPQRLPSRMTPPRDQMPALVAPAWHEASSESLTHQVQGTRLWKRQREMFDAHEELGSGHAELKARKMSSNVGSGLCEESSLAFLTRSTSQTAKPLQMFSGNSNVSSLASLSPSQRSHPSIQDLFGIAEDSMAAQSDDLPVKEEGMPVISCSCNSYATGELPSESGIAMHNGKYKGELSEPTTWRPGPCISSPNISADDRRAPLSPPPGTPGAVSLLTSASPSAQPIGPLSLSQRSKLLDILDNELAGNGRHRRNLPISHILPGLTDLSKLLNHTIIAKLKGISERLLDASPTKPVSSGPSHDYQRSHILDHYLVAPPPEFSLNVPSSYSDIKDIDGLILDTWQDMLSALEKPRSIQSDHPPSVSPASPSRLLPAQLNALTANNIIQAFALDRQQVQRDEATRPISNTSSSLEGLTVPCKASGYDGGELMRAVMQFGSYQ